MIRHPRVPGAVNRLYAVAIGDIGEVISGKSGYHRQRQAMLHEVMALNRGRHEYRLGLDYERLTPERLNPTASMAAFYPTLRELIAGEAPLLARSLAEAASSAITAWSVFAQDIWRPTPRLSFIYGTRWELTPAPSLRLARGEPVFQMLGSASVAVSTGVLPRDLATVPVSGANGPFPTALWPSRLRQFAPRLGIAYRLANSSVLRASWGVFYHVGFSAAADAINGSPFNRWQLSTGGLANSFASVQGYHFDAGLRVPRVLHWNIAMETALNTASMASIAYVGSSGRNLLRREGTLLSPELFGDRVGGVSGVAYVQRMASSILATNHGESDYHALQVRLRLRMKQGLLASAAYTWSHSIDNGSWDSGVSLVDSNRGINAARDRGSSSFDARHAFHAALTQDLAAAPLGTWWRRAAEGWTVQSLARARTGFPLDIRAGANRLGLGFDNISRPDWNGPAPTWLSDPYVPGGLKLNAAAFKPAPGGAQGNLGRNAIRGFGMWSVDLSMMRSFAVTNHSRVEFRAEAFNAFNTPSFADPVAFLEDARFGQSASMLGLMLGTGTPRSGLTPAFQTGGPRMLQLILRWHF